MTRFGSVALGVVLLLGLACATSSRGPEWIRGVSPEAFPESRYLTALGTGATLEDAAARAKAELARTFSATLESELALIDVQREADGALEETSDLRIETRIDTDARLEGVSVPLSWRDPDDGTIWALAALERGAECERVALEGRRLQAELAGRVEAMRATQPGLMGLRHAWQAVERAESLDRLEARSRVLRRACLPGRRPPTGALRAERASRQDALTFEVRSAELAAGGREVVGPLPELREKLAEVLAARGLRVVDAPSAAALPLRAWLRFEPLDRGTNWSEVRWAGAIELSGARAGGDVELVVQADGSESHPIPETARFRARRSGGQELSRRLDTLLERLLRDPQDPPPPGDAD